MSRSGSSSQTKVTYYQGSANLTSALLSSAGKVVTVAPGKFVLVEVRMKVLAQAKVGTKKAVKVSATWSGDAKAPRTRDRSAPVLPVASWV